ncbi:MAG: cell division protein FtsQ/DivIB [Pseudomonadota bacterium]
MRPLSAPPRPAGSSGGAPRRRRDPAPSRISFRIKRLWRSERVRRALTVYAPAALVVAVVGWTLSQAELRALAVERWETLSAAVAARPEFAVRRIVVRGAEAAVAREVTAALAPYRGASSLSADAEAIRGEVLRVGWVESANVRLSAPESLIVTIRQRAPAALWRNDGALILLDETGVEIGPAGSRAAYPHLPVIAGRGADKVVTEARAVIAAAAVVAPRLRGLVRIGERRWDAVLQDGPLVLLPAEGAVEAMGYLAALQSGENVLGRDVEVIDLRLGVRPTLRLSPDAADALGASREPPKTVKGKDA